MIKRAIFTIITFLVLFIPYYFRESIKRAPIFDLKKIVFSNTKHYKFDELLEKVHQDEKNSIFDIDLDEINQTLLKLPWIKNVVITRILPDTLKISLEEHKIRGVVFIDKLYYYGDDYKMFLKISYSDINDYTIFSGVDIHLYEQNHNEFINKISEMEKLNSLVKNILPEEFDISEIHQTLFRGYEIIFRENRGKIILGFNSFEENLKKAKDILNHFNKEKKEVSLIAFQEMKNDSNVIVKLKKGGLNE
ncbi:FtsQ-type POTRA domain-containing protein [bacterium]|nr:FtsQ-type POTRA domain-containing protein [bacterium]